MKAWFVLLLAAAAGGGAAGAPPPPGADRMNVPGGTGAVVRLLGSVDPARERFAGSLVRVLLTTVPPDQDVTGLPLRADMDAYVRVAGVEARLHGGDVRIDPAAPSAARMLADLADTCGFRPQPDGGALEPLPGPGNDRRRRAAQALGWNLPRAARQFAKGKAVVLPLVEESVDAPLPLAEWSAIVGHVVTPDSALAELVMDQRIGLLVEGLRRLPSATRAALDAADRRALYALAPGAFYRYGGAFEFEDGAAVVPGGAAAAPEWAALAGGVAPADGRAFLRALLSRNASRGAYLFHALRTAPPRAAAALLREPGALRRLDAALSRSGLDVGDARGRDPGLGLLLRAVPVTREGEPRLDLPFGNGPWLSAAAGRAATRAAELPDAAFAAALLERRMTIFNIERPALPVVARAAALLPAAAVDEPGMVYDLVQAAARFAPALDVLAELAPADGRAPRAYLAALQRLDRLVDDRPADLALIARFEGGVELLRRLARSGALTRADALRRLAAWSDAQAPRSGPPADPRAFLRDVLAALPDPPDGGPGRGQEERRLLAALANGLQPECFRWSELEYCPGPARDGAARLAAALAVEDVPPLDAVLAAGDAAAATTHLVLPAFLGALAADLPEREAALVRVGHHGLVRRPGNRRYRIDLSDSPWQPSRWSSGADDEYGPRTTGHLGAVARAVAEIRFRLPAGAGAFMAATTEQARAFWLPALEGPWHLVTPADARAVAALERAGAGLLGAALRGGPGDPAFAFVAARVPRARLDRARAAGARPAASPGERVGLALAALEGDDAGGPRPELLGGDRAALEAARAAAGTPLRAALAVAGAPMPAVDGSRAPVLRPWPAYETLASEGDLAALREREWLDLRLAILAWLGRAGLPGAVGADVARQTLADLADTLVLENERDWEGVLRFVDALDDASFDERMRRCLAAQLFVVRAS